MRLLKLSVGLLVSMYKPTLACRKRPMILFDFLVCKLQSTITYQHIDDEVCLFVQWLGYKLMLTLSSKIKLTRSLCLSLFGLKVEVRSGLPTQHDIVFLFIRLWGSGGSGLWSRRRWYVYVRHPLSGSLFWALKTKSTVSLFCLFVRQVDKLQMAMS